MAVEITGETMKEYKERLRTFDTERLRSCYRLYTEPGYNCEGLVCADGVVVPREKFIDEVLRERGVYCRGID